MSRIASIIAVALLLAGSAARAQDAADPGFYIVTSVGVASGILDDVASNARNLGVTVNADDNKTGYGVAAGYRFLPYASAEAGYFYSPGWNIVVDRIATEYDISAFHLAARAELPLEYATPYIKAGVHFWDADASGGIEDSDGNDLLYGVGLEVPFPARPEVSVRIEWTRYTAEESNLDLDTDFYSLGLLYRF